AVTIGGTGKPIPQTLFFSHSGITAEHAAENRFNVTIAADVPGGDHDVCLVTNTGLTNQRRFAVGLSPDVNEAESPQRNDRPSTAQMVPFPATIHATIDPATDRDCHRFRVDDNQRLMIRCRSATLEGTVSPALTLIDTAGREVRHDP